MAKPAASIPMACHGWAETMAAYRFLGNDEVEWRDIMAPHWARTEARMGAHAVVLCLQDTTELDFNQHYIMSVTAADRPGLLFGVAETLASNGINLHTAKIATLGERVEDTFLISGPNLTQDTQVLKIETELLEKLAI